MMFRPAAALNKDDYLYIPAGDQYGEGWFSDRWDDVKKVAKTVQKNDTVRNLEKGALNVGAKALRGAVETGLDGVADSALTAIGAPELAPLVNTAIDRGAKSLQNKGVQYLDQQIDASGKGVRYMSPSGGGMRLAGSGTQLGSGLRLAGGLLGYADWEEKKSRELAGAMGLGMRLAGSGHGWDSIVTAERAYERNKKGNGMMLAGSGHGWDRIVTGFHEDMAERAKRHKVPRSGNGMRIAGSGIYARPLLEGSGCACH